MVRKLERNYRSTQTILDASGAVVAHNRGRRGKRLWTEAGAGEKLELYKASDEQDEAKWVVRTLQGLRQQHALSGMAILVRTNAQTRALEDELLREQVPYSLVGGVRFYERAEIKDLVAYLRVLRNPRDTISLPAHPQPAAARHRQGHPGAARRARRGARPAALGRARCSTSSTACRPAPPRRSPPSAT